jgi:hypothetical protein
MKEGERTTESASRWKKYNAKPDKTGGLNFN